MKKQDIAGKTIVITGAIPGCTKQEAAVWIRANGGIWEPDVTLHTDILIIGAAKGATGKLKRARRYNFKYGTVIAIVPAEAFEKLMRDAL